MNKGIIGGTFNPIHNGHIKIASMAVKQFNLDKMLFIPAGNPPHKTDKIITDANIRINMINSTIKSYDKFELCDYEVEKKGLSYTYETLSYLNKKEKDTEWYFITGADCLMQLETWKNVDVIMSLCHFVVFFRPGYELKDLYTHKKFTEDKYNKEIILLNNIDINISSSEIRSKVKNNEDIRELVPNEVYKIINDKKLYK